MTIGCVSIDGAQCTLPPEVPLAASLVRRSEVAGWAMYDFANSSFTTAIVTVYYAQYFPGVIVGDAPDYKLGNLLWSVTLSVSYLLAVVTLPLLGAWMDAVGHKKRFLLASTVVTVAAT